MINMRYFATYDTDGSYTGFYSDEWHGDNIPTPNIELTEAQWKEANSTRCRYHNGQHEVWDYSQQELDDSAMNGVRSTRGLLLKESDWTQMPDSPLTETKKQEWAAYRQQLRDLPATVDLLNIIYPTKPI